MREWESRENRKELESHEEKKELSPSIDTHKHVKKHHKAVKKVKKEVKKTAPDSALVPSVEPPKKVNPKVIKEIKDILKE